MSDYQATCCTLLLCSIVCVWFYWNTGNQIDYDFFTQLTNKTSGERKKPNELINLAPVIIKNQTYIDSTNAEQRLYDLVYQLNLENPFIIDYQYSNPQDLAVSGWPVSNQSLCTQQLGWIVNQLSSNVHFSLIKGKQGLELAQFMDSIGQPEAGTYTGSTQWVGWPSQCLKSSLANGSIKTRYCWAKLRPKSWPRDEISYVASRIRVGVCLPETCDTTSFDKNQRAIETLAKYKMSEFLKGELEITGLYCIPDERSPLRQIPTSGYVWIGVMLTWTALVILSTILYELGRRKISLQESEMKKLTGSTQQVSIKDQVLEALSLRCSIKTFKEVPFKVRYKDGQRVRVNLSALDTPKVAMAIFIVLGHSALFDIANSRSLGRKIELLTGDFGYLTLCIFRVVDTFFLMFGALATYTMMRKFNPKQLGNPLIWLGVNLGIFLRTAPLFMIVFWFARSVSPHLASGPWWDYGIDRQSAKYNCMTSPWWTSIPHLGSLGKLAVPTCNLPSWFIVSYSHLSLFIPPITFVICRYSNDLKRYALVAFLLVSSALNIGYRMYRQNTLREDSLNHYGGFLADLLEKYEPTGQLMTLGRLGSTTVGCLVGYMLRQYELYEIVEWPNWMRTRLTLITVIFLHLTTIFLPFIGHLLSQYLGHDAKMYDFILANTGLIILWPILNGLLIVMCTTVYNHLVSLRFLAHPFWHVFNRLGLCIFLVHWEIIYVSVLSFEQAPNYGFVDDVLRLWAYALGFSILLAFILHILVESPLSRLAMILARAFSPNDGFEKPPTQSSMPSDIIAT